MSEWPSGAANHEWVVVLFVRPGLPTAAPEIGEAVDRCRLACRPDLRRLVLDSVQAAPALPCSIRCKLLLLIFPLALARSCADLGARVMQHVGSFPREDACTDTVRCVSDATCKCSAGRQGRSDQAGRKFNSLFLSVWHRAITCHHTPRCCPLGVSFSAAVAHPWCLRFPCCALVCVCAPRLHSSQTRNQEVCVGSTCIQAENVEVLPPEAKAVAVFL